MQYFSTPEYYYYYYYYYELYSSQRNIQSLGDEIRLVVVYYKKKRLLTDCHHLRSSWLECTWTPSSTRISDSLNKFSETYSNPRPCHNSVNILESDILHDPPVSPPVCVVFATQTVLERRLALNRAP